MTITLEDLKAAGACHEALRAFAKAFPEGAPSIEAIADHPDCRPEWRGLMAVYLPGCDRETGLDLIWRSDDTRHLLSLRRMCFCGLAAVYARWCDRETGLALLEHSSTRNYWNMRAALEAHWCDHETALRLLGPYKDDRYFRNAVAARFAA